MLFLKSIFTVTARNFIFSFLFSCIFSVSVCAQSCFTTLTTSTTNATCGSSNGTATVSVTGGSTPYTYNWSSGASTNTATGLSAGAYTVTVTSAAGGSATFWNENFTSGGAGWTLNINGPGTNDFYSNEWIINSDYSACTQCGTSGGNLLHITCSSLDVDFCPLFGGPSCVFNAGGIDPILTDKYVSSPDISTVGKTNMTLKFWYQSVGQAGGDYGKVRLSNDGGGTWTDLAASYANTSACTQASVSIPASYENIANFRIGFRWVNNDNSSGNDPPFSIDDVELWSPAGGGCDSVVTVTVNQNTTLTLSTTTVNAGCGLSDGTATVTSNNGTAPYTYLWNDGGNQSTSTATGLAAASYSVTVTSSEGCTGTASATVSGNAGPSATASSTPAACGNNNGTATANVSGGTSPYTYLWNDGGGQITSTATGLSAGSYSVTVSDAGGCTATASATVSTSGGLTVAMAATTTNCTGSTGTATATPSGGVSPYTYTWSNSQSASTATGLAAGNISVTVTDAGGCTGTSSVTVNTASGPTVAASSTPTSCTGNTGTATATPSGGVSPYTYTWSISQSTSTITGLAAGIYSVTVTDANSCTGTGSATVTSAGSPTVTTSSTDASCTSNTGTATATASGGTPPYSYLWNDSTATSSSTATGLGAGNYSVTVTDAGGCTVTGSATVNSPGAPTLTTSQTPASCGASNGTATVNASSGTPPYTYLWCNGGTASTATGLSSGNCSVTVTGAAGASTPFWSEDFTSGGTGWTLNLSSGTNDANANEWIINSDYSACTQCGSSGGNLLHITCNPSDPFCPAFGGPSCVYNAGGIDPILTDKFVSSPDISTVGYSNITLKFWYGSNGESGSDYGQVRLSNDGGATWTDLAFQYAGLAVCIQKTINIPATYENISNFRIAFRWVNNDNSGGNDPPFSIDDITLSTPSGGGCSATATVNVGQTNTLTLSSSSTSPSCGQSNGTATVTPSNGASPYSYSWQNGQSASTATGLAAGSYAVTVTDAGGCTATTSVSISSSGGPSLSMATSNPLCYGGATGVATVAPSGGTPPYTYSWSNGKTTQINMNVAAATYYVTVTDAGGCSVVDSAVIANPIPIYVSFTIQDANCGVTDGFAQAAVDSGGTSPYSYQWSNGSTIFFNGSIGAGTYFLTVTDANGCKTTDTALVSNIGAATVTINTITNLACSGNTNGAISINVSGGTPPLTYTWSNGATTQNLSGGTAGNYTVSVSDAMGCITIESATITEPPAIVIVLSSANVNCSGSNQLSVIVSGGTPGYSLNWSTGSNNDTISGLSPGTYSVTVTDSTGCTNTASSVINAPIAVNAGADTTIFAGDNAPLKATATGGNPPLSYNWTPGNLSQQNPTVTPPSTTTYSVNVTDADSCTATDSLTITVIECDEPFVPSAFSPNNDKFNDVFYIRGLSVECYDAMSFILYNRWGQKVFETNSSANGWDGTINGKSADTEVFVYYLKITYKSGETKTLKGNTTLVR